MSFRTQRVLFCLALCFGLIQNTPAEITLPALFSDHMVLQQNRPITVWGSATPGERVTVAIGGQQITTDADGSGAWLVQLSPLTAGGPHTLKVTGTNEHVFNNVLIGDVWICSGQSNMAFALNRVNNAEEEIATANYPNIRLFTVKRDAAQTPRSDVTGSWAVCDSQSAKSFSAVGYFFGRRLNTTLGVPIGLINTSWGGTPVEAWTALSALQNTPEYAPLEANWDKALSNYAMAQEKYETAVETWKIAADSAKAAGGKAPNRPGAPRGPNHPHRPAILYNGMIAPLTPFPIAGAIWYQGESNAGRAYQYRTLFPTMIQNWRAEWGQGDFPFFFVQLANYKTVKDQPGDSDWAELREAQSMTLKLPNTGQAVIIDIGEADDIHPRNKQDVGLRLALAAETVAYGKKQAYSGPVYKSMTIKRKKVTLTFDHVNGGLKTKGDKLQGFAIAGADQKFVWAEAKIVGNTIEVWSKDIAKPVAVRYAWADNPVCNLYNGADLPASPFRTDTWPGITVDKK